MVEQDDQVPALTAKSPAALDDQATGQLVVLAESLERESDEAERFILQGSMIGRSPEAGPNGKGYADADTDAAYTLDIASGVQGVAFAENQKGEMWEAPITQALSGGGGKPGQGYQATRIGASVRRLTPLECERLQGFPDGWTDLPSNSDSQRYKQLGNAVAVPVVEWILKRIMLSDNPAS